MPINIHGKSYNTVAERIISAGDNLIEVNTEVLYTDPVVIKATIKTKKGTFTGISAANPSKQLEKESPWEVAETSAVGRALAFAGYETTNGIASAEEMRKITPLALSGKSSPAKPMSVSGVSSTASPVGFTTQDGTFATATCSICNSHMYFREGDSAKGHWTALFCEGDKEHKIWNPKESDALNYTEVSKADDVEIDKVIEDIESLPF